MKLEVCVSLLRPLHDTAKDGAEPLPLNATSRSILADKVLIQKTLTIVPRAEEICSGGVAEAFFGEPYSVFSNTKTLFPV